jgi:polysaccharide export outer membrane protein
MFKVIHLPKLFALLCMMTFMTSCAALSNWLPSAGPHSAQVSKTSAKVDGSGIEIVELDDSVNRRLLANQTKNLFSNVFGSGSLAPFVIDAGDVLEVTVWEAPPAVLFSSSSISSISAIRSGGSTTLPVQMVDREGTINIPFVGQVSVSGRSPAQVQTEIMHKLENKANQPQVLVRVISNNTANVTVVGEVAASARVPLTPKGERLLDALAAAGGVRQPINKMTLQVTRGKQVVALPLDTIIRDPEQNILLQAGDVVTSMFQPLSFMALGASGKNEEINFETQGISLMQALARVGGLQDNRANSRGVFIFRFESPENVNAPESKVRTSDGKVPVIYRVDFKNPASFFFAQNFYMQNQDIMYVSNAPVADLQKFLNVVVSVVYPINNIVNFGK